MASLGASPNGAQANPGTGMLPRSVSLPDLPQAGSTTGFAGGKGSSMGSTVMNSTEGFTITQLRDARKKADLDAQTLANRIALLRQEGEKATRRIQETNLRAMELELRPLKASEHEAFLRQRLKEIHKQQRKNHASREHGRAVIQSVKSALLEKNRRIAMETRDSTKKMLESKATIDRAQKKLLTDRVTALKERLVGEEKQRMLEEARTEQFRKNRQERTQKGNLEVTLRAHTEKRISQMEEEEAQLLDWLEAKQAEQAEAYQGLAAIADARRQRSSAHSRSTLAATSLTTAGDGSQRAGELPAVEG